MKRFGLFVSLLAFLGAGLSAQQGTISVSFWTAPNQGQFDYWDKVIQKFNAAGVTVDGKTVTVKAQKMPEAPSSEAGIQNALATNSAPALSENINRGFAATLAASGRVYDIQNDAVFKEIVGARKMESLMPGWAIDGKQYVIPLYGNAMGYHWNMVALRELGFKDRVPTTLDDMKTLIANFKKLKDTTMKKLGVNHLFMRPQLLHPEWWWDRWFDYIMQYNAFTGGQSLVTGDKLTMEKKAAKEVFEFFGSFGSTLQTAEEWNAFEQNVVPVVFQVSAPWDLPKYEAAGKKYGFDGDYAYGPPIVKKAGDKPYTFADSKGMVFYKGGNVTEEQHKGAVAFLAWAYSAANSTDTDLAWFKATGMLPMRGDLATNPIFVDYIKSKPALAEQAKLIPYSIPAMASEKMTDIQQALGEKGLTPYIQAAKKAATVPSADSYVDKALEAMRKAGKLK